MTKDIIKIIMRLLEIGGLCAFGVAMVLWAFK